MVTTYCIASQKVSGLLAGTLALTLEIISNSAFRFGLVSLAAN